jgi:hypothetical protein
MLESEHFLMQTEPNCRILEHPQRCSVWDPTKIFLTWKISYLVFCNTKKLGLQIGGILLIANHLDQSLWLANQKQGVVVRSNLLHSSLAGAHLCCAFSNPQHYQMCWPKPFFWDKLACFDISSSNFTVQGPILSTPGECS